jgi:protein TonB
VSPEPEFFPITEASGEARPTSEPGDGNRARIASVLFHVLVLAAMLFGTKEWLSDEEWDESLAPRVRFYIPGGEGPGGGGGGGGSGGKRPTAYIPTRLVDAIPPAEKPEPRRAPIAPRKPRALNFDDLEVPDLPTETASLFEGVFSPDAVELPGLSWEDSRDWGGVDTEPSSGSGGGIGGGTGTGVGTGEGWGVGPGSGGGTGGGRFSPGAYDIEPRLIYKPPAGPYPPEAREAQERMVVGEVILEVLVKVDGSTEVMRVIKSLPYCVDAAKERARLFRFKPALKDGKPVEAMGIITVTFDLYAQGSTKS